MSKYKVGLKILQQEGQSEPECYAEFVYKFRKIRGKIDFFFVKLKKIVTRNKNIGYNITWILPQTACMIVNAIMVDSFASFFNWTTVCRSSD